MCSMAYKNQHLNMPRHMLSCTCEAVTPIAATHPTATPTKGLSKEMSLLPKIWAAPSQTSLVAHLADQLHACLD
jgi:hypothetical protein